MPNYPVHITVAQGGEFSSPTTWTFKYAVLNASKVFQSTLRGVVTTDPKFTASINGGSGQLALELDHYPSELTMGYYVRVDYPDGQVAGLWRFEGHKSVLQTSGSHYTLNLMPLVSEASDCDFNGNYSTDATQPGTPLGTTTVDVPVRAGLALTKDLTSLSLSNDGKLYGYVFNNATVKQTLDQACLFAGPGWWWLCDSMGRVTLSNVSPYEHVWNVGRDVTLGTWSNDILATFNVQTVIGGMASNTTTSLTATAVNTNTSDPLSVPSLGRRAAQPFSNSSLVDQISVNAMAASLLGYANLEHRAMTVHVTDYRTRRPQPGDAAYIRQPSPDPTSRDGVQGGGPYLITKVTEIGATYAFDVEIVADIAVPVMASNPNMQMDMLMQSLLRNPQISALSPNGQTGTIGAGVLSGQSPSGSSSTYATVPSAVVGVAVTTEIDMLAQANLSYALVSWSANPTTDVVAQYIVSYWRTSIGAASASTMQTSSLQLRIPGLVPGQQYAFTVTAANGSGVSGPVSQTVYINAAIKTTPPPPPTGVTATLSPRGALLQWLGVSGAQAPDIQGYLVQFAIASDKTGFRQINPQPMLTNSYTFVAPKFDAAGNQVTPSSVIIFQVASVDWSNNVSTWTPAIQVATDGVVFDEILAGNITATGTLTGGAIQTGSSGARATMTAGGIYLYDGSSTDHGGGPGVTFSANAQNGNVYMSGATVDSGSFSAPTITAGTITAATIDSATINSPTIDAGNINSANGGAGGSGGRMWLDLNNDGPSVGPLLVVSDGNYDRVQVGSLAEDGPFGAASFSPIQYGIRVKNAAGTNIYDSMGLTEITEFGPYSITTTLASPFTTTANSYINGTNALLSLDTSAQSRPTWFQFIWSVGQSEVANTGTWNYLYIYGGLWNQVAGQAVEYQTQTYLMLRNNAYSTVGSGFFSTYYLLTPGKYQMTYNYNFDTGTGPTWYLYEGLLQAFQIGGG